MRLDLHICKLNFKQWSLKECTSTNIQTMMIPSYDGEGGYGINQLDMGCCVHDKSEQLVHGYLYSAHIDILMNDIKIFHCIHMRG